MRKLRFGILDAFARTFAELAGGAVVTVLATVAFVGVAATVAAAVVNDHRKHNQYQYYC